MRAEHRIVDKWRDVTVECACGWRDSRSTLRAAIAGFRKHKAEKKQV